MTGAAEIANVPTIRTNWSIPTNYIRYWHRCHDTLAQAAARHRIVANATRIALLGDSITESWRGTSICRPVDRSRGVPAVLNKTVAQRWPNPLVLGISGDHTQHLLWRLQHGELSASMEADPGLIYNLLIGSNNLASGHSAQETLSGIMAIVEVLLKRTLGTVLVNAILPRGDADKLGINGTQVGETRDGKLPIDPSMKASSYISFTIFT